MYFGMTAKQKPSVLWLISFFFYFCFLLIVENISCMTFFFSLKLPLSNYIFPIGLTYKRIQDIFSPYIMYVLVWFLVICLISKLLSMCSTCTTYIYSFCWTVSPSRCCSSPWPTYYNIITGYSLSSLNYCTSSLLTMCKATVSLFLLTIVIP